MSKNGTLITVILSVLVVGATVWVGGLLLRDQQGKEAMIASGPDVILPPVIDDGDLETTDIIIDSPDQGDKGTLENEEFNNIGSPPVEERVSSGGIPPVVEKTPSISKSPGSAPLQGGTRYWVQAGSFSSLARATAAATALEGLGLSGGIETISQENRILYRLRFGAWMSIEEAERFRDYLRDQPALKRAFQERRMSDRSADFVDAYVVETYY
ncbi:SPOR domain-containing protein [Entomospira entomophila]|uniref:SPOR domain-containing protein n=1 Tax=Entomospira entomophila TaxID=2719988 RepID=A0A968KW47_9SPIO|nr:SPOR domain-containing protein [Entomospira entomophilus]NIZ40470.1 SPOR domain-containing protein [Entomospira entomophilus]WDI36028.1 SPOR domain-containing protein [Entomospira entomophilus]